MRNHPFSTLPMAISQQFDTLPTEFSLSQQFRIDNQNIHNTNNHVSLLRVRDDMLNF